MGGIVVLLHYLQCALKIRSCQSSVAEVYLVGKRAELWEVMRLSLGWSGKKLSSGCEYHKVYRNISSRAAGGRELP